MDESAFPISPIRHQLDADTELPPTLNKIVSGVFDCPFSWENSMYLASVCFTREHMAPEAVFECHLTGVKREIVKASRKREGKSVEVEYW